MGDMLKLKAGDGHTLGAYRAEPAAAPKGGIVILQEIFGITGHIRSVADSYAEQGYLAIAPSLFDRTEPDIVLDYAEIEKARGIMTSLDLSLVITDIEAAVNAARTAGRVATIGYCWGGAMADLSACRLNIDGAVSYYGRMTVEWLDEQPNCPVMYHYGGKDMLIPPELIEQINAGRSGHPSFVYPEAGHGFNCHDRGDFEPSSAQLALDRTLEFLNQHIDV